jgi:hypothetical protein
MKVGLRLRRLSKKLLINSSGTVSKGKTVLRQAQHERVILNEIDTPTVHPEPVEGRTVGFSTASKPECGTLVQ